MDATGPAHNPKDQCIVIQVGSIPIALHTDDPAFVEILRARFSDYFKPEAVPQFSFDVHLIAPDTVDPDSDVEVRLENGIWRMERGDFRATWNPRTGRGVIRQKANPYSIDSMLRIMHTLLLAPQGGFLLHASSAVRNGKAFLFSGLSEAGKTTMARLAPADVDLLTDEASYIYRQDGRYMACGTPFAGEFGAAGKNISAPISGLYLLAKAPHNSIDPLHPADAIRRIMRNVLFFAHDPELVRMVFESVCTFVATVPVFQLSFFPDPQVWDLIGREPGA